MDFPMSMKHKIRSVLSRRHHAVSLFLGLVFLGGCEDALDPASVDVTGVWEVDIGLVTYDFRFELEESPGGEVSGVWSYPEQFSYYAVRGRREGLVLSLTADSQNLFPATLRAEFVRKDRMEGTFYFEGTNREIVLRRGSYWSTP